MRTLNFILFTLILSLFHTYTKANLSKNWISYFGYGNTKICSIEFDTVSKHFYMVGTSSEPDLGTGGVHQPSLNNSSSDPIERLDIFLAKFTTAGDLVWFTYYGGSKRETNPGLALDKTGNIYVSGYTNSPSGIATSGAFKTSLLTDGADFLVKFDPQGQRLWGSYYNERINITPYGSLLAVDENNDVYMSGLTYNTTDIATPGTYQPNFYPVPNTNTGKNAYLVKFNASGQRIWGTYFGGGGEGWNKDIRTDKQNNIYITGSTVSVTNIASPGAMVSTANLSQVPTSFLAKFNTNGQRVWSTYIHPKEGSTISSLAIDAASNVYLFGMTGIDSGIATQGTHQPLKAQFTDFFLMKLNSAGQKVWGTYYGGEEVENEQLTINMGLDINFSKNRLRLKNGANPDIYVSGFSFSTTGIQKGCTIPIDTNFGGVLSKFSNNGQLIWGSNYNAPIFDFALGLNDSLYLVSNTSRDNLASSNAYQPSKPPQIETGLFGKLVEQYICPASFTLPFHRSNDSLIAQAGYLSYQWYRNDTLLQNGPQNYYKLTGNYQGVYKLKVTDRCNCTFNSDTLFVEQSSSLHNTTKNTLNLSISPNPATNQLNLHLDKQGQNQYQITIYNILGQKVFRSTSTFDPSNKKVIDVSNYSPGLYIISVESKEGKAKVKFIKQ